MKVNIFFLNWSLDSNYGQLHTLDIYHIFIDFLHIQSQIMQFFNLT